MTKFGFQEKFTLNNKHNYKGTVFVYSGEGENKKIMREYHNKFVLTGREFLLDAMWGIGTDWIPKTSPNVATGSWKGRFAALGSSTISNGINGPKESALTESGESYILADAGWAGASLYDWELGDEVLAVVGGNAIRATVEATREGVGSRAVEVEIVFTDAEVPAGDYYELGIFLSDGIDLVTPNGIEHPNRNPSEIITERPHAMLSRVVFYTQIGDKLFSDPVPKIAGTPITIRYVFQDV